MGVIPCPHIAPVGGAEDARASEETTDETSFVVVARSRVAEAGMREGRTRSRTGARTIGRALKMKIWKNLLKDNTGKV